MCVCVFVYLLLRCWPVTVFQNECNITFYHLSICESTHTHSAFAHTTSIEAEISHSSFVHLKFPFADCPAAHSNNGQFSRSSCVVNMHAHSLIRPFARFVLHFAVLVSISTHTHLSLALLLIYNSISFIKVHNRKHTCNTLFEGFTSREMSVKKFS